MGARGKNFYNDLVKRMGYEAAAEQIQELFLGGKRQQAAAAVPDALIDETSLVGPPARIKDRLQAWQALAQDNRIGTLLLAGATAESARVVAEAVL
jgi:alkanesulfonate monooxygenase SsuD/methylene tetrahydromethanopterin reductase-like flavin-dependent oxidoreductase (luciferase family)